MAKMDDGDCGNCGTIKPTQILLNGIRTRKSKWGTCKDDIEGVVGSRDESNGQDEETEQTLVDETTMVMMIVMN